jgi:hypothetical protein
MAINCIAELQGAAELSDWFGGFPSFHDAKMALQINGDGTGWLKAYGFRMTREVDANGLVVLDKFFAATFEFKGMFSVSISDFMPGLAILGQLKIAKSESAFEIDFSDTSYGLSGSLVCRDVKLTFQPDVRAP